MSAVDTAGVGPAAARAALDVPGVVGLQPSLRQSLARAAGRFSSTKNMPVPMDAGVRAERPAGTGAWRVEVRCVLDGERRALDTARVVRDRVRASVESCLGPGDTSGPVEVVVDVVRITVGRP